MVCEVGILNGTGLAIWCDLFPNSRCIGLDIDISNIKRNMDRLLELGVFGDNSPELYEYDQFVDSAELLNEFLDGDEIDIFMDDGIHHDDAIRPHSGACGHTSAISSCTSSRTIAMFTRISNRNIRDIPFTSMVNLQ